MRILVTGGAGFVGSHLVRSLLTDRYPAFAQAAVTVLDALTYAGNPANLASVSDSPRYRFVHGDVGDSALLDAVLPGHDLVVNCAAESHVDRSITGAAPFVRTNVLGLQTLLDACVRHDVRRVLQVSTDEVYGSQGNGRFVETDPLSPSSPYAASKAAGDLLAHAVGVTFGLDVVITRGSNTYGPHQHPEKLVPRAITNLLRDQPVPLYGDGLNVRDWLHVDDHCSAIALVLERGRPGETYNVSGGTSLTNREVVDRLLALCGKGEALVGYVADRPGHDRRYAVDDSKLRSELGFKVRTPWRAGTDATVGWYRDNQRWWRPPVGGPTG